MSTPAYLPDCAQPANVAAKLVFQVCTESPK